MWLGAMRCVLRLGLERPSTPHAGSARVVFCTSAWLMKQPAHLWQTHISVVRHVSTSAGCAESEPASHAEFGGAMPVYGVHDDTNGRVNLETGGRPPSPDSGATVRQRLQPFNNDKDSLLATQETTVCNGWLASAGVLQEGDKALKSRFCKETRQENSVNELVNAIRNKDDACIRRRFNELQKCTEPMESNVLHRVMRVCRFRRGGSQVAEDFVELMKNKGVTPSEKSYVCLLKSLCRDEKLRRAYETLHGLAATAPDEASGRHPKLRPHMVNIVLGFCARMPNFVVFDNCVKLMERNGLQPDASTYMHMLKINGVTRVWPKIRAKWAEVVEAFPPHPPVPLHRMHVNALAQAGAVWEARVALEEMMERMHAGGWAPVEVRRRQKLDEYLVGAACHDAEEEEDEPSESDPRIPKSWAEDSERKWPTSDELRRAYGLLMSGASAAGELQLLKLLLHEVEVLGLGSFEPGKEYNLLLRAAARSGDFTEVHRLMEVMASRKMRVSMHARMSWMQAHCNLGRLEMPLRLLDGALVQKEAHKAMFEIIATSCAVKKDLAKARKTVSRMKEANLKPSDQYFTTLFCLSGIAMSANGADVPLELRRIHDLKEDMRYHKIKQSPMSLHARVWAYGQGGALDEMLGCIRWARGRVDSHNRPLLTVLLFNTAIQASLSHNNTSAMLELVETMQEQGLPSDLTANDSLWSEFAFQVPNMDSANAFLNALQDIGHTLNLSTFHFLIQVACLAGKVDHGLELLDKMEREHGLHPEAQILQTLLDFAARKGHVEVMEKMLERTKSEGLIPDFDTCSMVVSAYAKRGRHEDAIRALEDLASQILAQQKSSAQGQLLYRIGAMDGARARLVADLVRLRGLLERDKENLAEAGRKKMGRRNPQRKSATRKRKEREGLTTENNTGSAVEVGDGSVKENDKLVDGKKGSKRKRRGKGNQKLLDGKKGSKRKRGGKEMDRLVDGEKGSERKGSIKENGRLIDGKNGSKRKGSVKGNKKLEDGKKGSERKRSMKESGQLVDGKKRRERERSSRGNGKVVDGKKERERKRGVKENDKLVGGKKGSERKSVRRDEGSTIGSGRGKAKDNVKSVGEKDWSEAMAVENDGGSKDEFGKRSAMEGDNLADGSGKKRKRKRRRRSRRKSAALEREKSAGTGAVQKEGGEGEKERERICEVGSKSFAAENVC